MRMREGQKVRRNKNLAARIGELLDLNLAEEWLFRSAR